jgi:hypothetical protein
VVKKAAAGSNSPLLVGPILAQWNSLKQRDSIIPEMQVRSLTDRVTNEIAATYLKRRFGLGGTNEESK